MKYSKFETELQVRPDDIDMNQHVHNSRYFDYVLAARYEQMEHNYRFPMQQFLSHGFGWVITKALVNYKRPLGLGDHFIVKTGITDLAAKGCIVAFEITNKKTGKLCADGEFEYTMVNVNTGRAETIPDWIIEHYAI
jgi:YbgC/YbaW family acyl-CoA thioester hydrolase